MHLVSVIVPVYNVEMQLRNCILSIVRQTYKNIEIILVDDGSTDSSGIICDQLAECFNNIKVIHKENGGLSSARNTALRFAKGDYYVFVDSDDYVADNMIEVMMKKADGADLVICNYKKVDTYGIEEKQDPVNTDETFWQKDTFWDKCYFKGLWVFCVVTWNKLYNKRLFDHVTFPERKLHEDEYVIGQIITQTNKIKVISDCLYYYLQRQGSIMHQRQVGNLDLAEALLNRCEIFEKEGDKVSDILRQNLMIISEKLVLGLFEDHNKNNKSRFYFLRSKYFNRLRKYRHQKFDWKFFLKTFFVRIPYAYYVWLIFSSRLKGKK